MRSHCFFFFFIASFCFASFASGATLAQDEVEALRDIGKTLGKDWDFNVDPCSGESNWSTDGKNNVTCSCDGANGTVCHVTRIFLKEQNLPGTLPRNLFKLPYLQEIDLTRNYLNGTIPKEWGSTKLVTISLLGNRLTGEIPTEITNISTLLDLNLEANQFSGILPLELGNLTQIQRLLINSNKFTGELPISLARLSKLQDFRIGDNQFSGKIPDFIHQNLTNLGILSIVGSGLSGPIPSEISHLQNLTDLRITDLRGSETSTFPPVDKMKLEILDLSFNKLTGPIPDTYETIAGHTKNIFGICSLLYAGAAAMGYTMFGEAILSQFTLNMPQELVATKIAVWTTVVNPLTKTGLVLSTLVIGLSVPFFGLVMSLIGSLFTMLVSLILPCVCFLKILRGKVTRLQAALCVTIIMVGVVCSSFGTYSALSEIIKSLRG